MLAALLLNNQVPRGGRRPHRYYSLRHKNRIKVVTPTIQKAKRAYAELKKAQPEVAGQIVFPYAVERERISPKPQARPAIQIDWDGLVSDVMVFRALLQAQADAEDEDALIIVLAHL